jgi:hypothetical protein
MKLREILTPTFKEPNLRLITANSMKGRNYIFFDQLGKIFDYYEEKNKSDQLTQVSPSEQKSDNVVKDDYDDCKGFALTKLQAIA